MCRVQTDESCRLVQSGSGERFVCESWQSKIGQRPRFFFRQQQHFLHCLNRHRQHSDSCGLCSRARRDPPRPDRGCRYVARTRSNLDGPAHHARVGAASPRCWRHRQRTGPPRPSSAHSETQTQTRRPHTDTLTPTDTQTQRHFKQTRLTSRRGRVLFCRSVMTHACPALSPT